MTRETKQPATTSGPRELIPLHESTTSQPVGAPDQLGVMPTRPPVLSSIVFHRGASTDLKLWRGSGRVLQTGRWPPFHVADIPVIASRYPPGGRRQRTDATARGRAKRLSVRTTRLAPMGWTKPKPVNGWISKNAEFYWTGVSSTSRSSPNSYPSSAGQTTKVRSSPCAAA